MPTPKPYTAADGTVTWRVRVRAGGKETSETFPNLTAAQGFCHRVNEIGANRAVDERARRDPGSDLYVPTLREWYRTHMANLTGVTDGTRQDYDRLAHRVMLPMLGAIPLDLITRAEVARFVGKLEHTPALDNRGQPAKDGRTLSPKTISTHHGLLSALMKAAVAEGLIEQNPCLATRLPRAGEQDRADAHFLTHAEYDAIEAALPDKWVPLVRLLVGTGMRWSEATALQTRHVDLATGQIRVLQAWKRPKKGDGRKLGPPKSRKSRRVVQVPDQVMALLAPMLAGREPEAFVFQTTTGTALHHGSWHSRVWVPACTKAGVVNPRPRVHDLRHTHASWLLEAGASLEQVQDQLGHESIVTTRRVYGELQPGHRAAVRQYATATLAPRPQIEG